MLPASDLSIIGRTNLREPHRVFGIKQDDRLAHMYVVGKTGTGKTTLLEGLLVQDIAAGRGCALIDPHGDLAERVAAHCERLRRPALIVDLAGEDLAHGYNPLLRVSPGHRPLVASGLLDVFKKQWAEAWGVRMEHILRNALITLLDQPSATLADILPLLSDKTFRLKLLARVQSEPVRNFWLKEFPNYSFRYKADGIAPIQNKVGAFLADPRLARFLAPKGSGLRLREIMDKGQVLIINLSQGRLGADSANLLGGLLVTSLGSAAFSRATLPPAARRPFYLVVDEFQSFTTLSLANMLAELRKFGVAMTLGHQYLHQLDPDILHAVLGNAGTLIAFRLGGEDAEVIARELQPVFRPQDLISLPNYSILVRLMVDGAPLRPFSAVTLPVNELPGAFQCLQGRLGNNRR